MRTGSPGGPTSHGPNSGALRNPPTPRVFGQRITSPGPPALSRRRGSPAAIGLPVALRDHPVPEGDADPGPCRGNLGHGVLPIPLEPASGRQQVASPEKEGPGAAAAVGADKKPPRVPQRDQHHDR